MCAIFMSRYVHASCDVDAMNTNGIPKRERIFCWKDFILKHFTPTKFQSVHFDLR